MQSPWHKEESTIEGWRVMPLAVEQELGRLLESILVEFLRRDLGLVCELNGLRHGLTAASVDAAALTVMDSCCSRRG